MGNFSLDLTAGPAWLLIGAIVIGFLLALWTYRHTIPKTTRAKRNTLIALRSLGIALLLFTIFQPIATSVSTHEVKPALALALDNSQSMQLSVGDKTARTRRAAMLESMHAAIPQDVLSDKNTLSALAIGEHSTPLPDPTSKDLDTILSARASVTDLSSVFTAMRDLRKTKNVEALLLYTDGSFTAGTNPVYAAEQLGVPVYAVGLGDSSEPRDVSVTELFTNDVATVDVPQPVDITLHYGGVKPGERVQLYLYAENEKIDERIIAFKQATGDEALSFTFKAKTEGTVKLSARISALDQEATTKNNVRLAYVKVLKNKFRIAIFAGAPSSDVSFVRSSLEANPSLQVSTYIQKQGAEFYDGAPDRAKVGDVDLVVLIGYPVISTSPQSLDLVRQLLITESKPLLFIPSRQLDFSKIDQLTDALPFRVRNLHPGANEIRVSPSLSPSAAESPLLHVTGKDRATMHWEDLAPLFKSETHIEPRPESDVLAEATIQGVKLGEPLIMTRRLGNARQVALTGYGLWQWKLVSFGREQAYRAQSRLLDTAETSVSALDLFLGNATRWLTTRDENKRVRVAPTRKFYEAGERIDIAGQVYDESFQPIENADVTIKISGGGLKTPVQSSLQPFGNGRYSALIPNGLPAGDYVYSSTAARNGKSIGVDDGRFNVGEFNVEFAEPRMRSDILRAMAERTGGKFYTIETASNVMKDILASARFKPQKLEDRKDFELWNAWPLLLLSLLFFSAEWLMRKRLGML